MTEVPEFQGVTKLVRLVSRQINKGIYNVTGYIALTKDDNAPAYFFNLIYHQEKAGEPVGIVNLIIYNKVYGKDVATIVSADEDKLYTMTNSEKFVVLYNKAWSTKEDTFVESGTKLDLARPYAEAVETWLTQIFVKA
jgi:hypothetical protein